MSRLPTLTAAAALLATPPTHAQTTTHPFPADIRTDDVTVVRVVDFASIPDMNGEAPRMMLLVDEPGTRRLFVNDMRGPLYGVSYDGRTVTRYVDIGDPAWGVEVQSSGRERGFQSFAFHPDFAHEGAPGYGRFYTWADLRDTRTAADYRPPGGNATHHTVLLEWTARNAASPTYDGGPPRALLRVEQPYANHNGGHLAFNPTAAPGDEPAKTPTPSERSGPPG